MNEGKPKPSKVENINENKNPLNKFNDLILKKIQILIKLGRIIIKKKIKMKI